MLYEVLPRYPKPLKSEDVNIFNDENWDKAVDFYDEKKYHDTILNVLKYQRDTNINEKSIKKALKKDGEAKFSIVHDLITLDFRLNSEYIEVFAPLVKTTEDTNIIALLRKVAEVNFDYFNLSRIFYKDGEVFVKYKEPIELCKPIKIHWLFHEIAVEGNRFFSLFCQKYSCEPIREPSVKRLNEKEIEKTKEDIKIIFEDYDKYKVNFIDNQREAYVWDILQLSFLKIYNMPQVNGNLQHELIRIIGLMYDSDYSIKYRIEKGTEFIEDLKSRDFSEIEANLHHPNKMIYMLYRFDKEGISQKLQNSDETIQRYIKDENHMGISYYLTERLLSVLYDYDLPKEYKKEIEDTLLKSQKREYEDASKRLLNSYYKLKNGTIQEEMGLAQKLFWTLLAILFIYKLIKNA